MSKNNENLSKAKKIITEIICDCEQFYLLKRQI